MGLDESIRRKAKWRSGFDGTQVEAGSLGNGRNVRTDEITPLQLISKIKFATAGKTASTVFAAKRRWARGRDPDRNSRRSRAFAGSVGSLNSIHRAPELRIIQLRVFSVLLPIYRGGDQTFAAPPHFRTMHYLAPIVLGDVRMYAVPLTEDYR